MLSQVKTMTNEIIEDRSIPPVVLSDDDSLDASELIKKYRKEFIKHFMPKHVAGIQGHAYLESYRDENNDTKYLVMIPVRVRAHYIPVKGKYSTVKVKEEQFTAWRKNIELHAFIGTKNA